VFYGNLGNSKNKGTSIWDFVPNYGLEKFATSKLLDCRPSVLDRRHIQFCWYGTCPLIVTRSSPIPSAAAESHEAVNNI